MNQPEQLAKIAHERALERALERAEHNSTAIAQLLDSPGWLYLSRRLTERRQKIRDDLADNDLLTDAQTRTARALVKEYTELLNLPTQDRAIHLATLAASRRQDSGPARG